MSFYTSAQFCFLARQEIVAMATRPFFASRFLPLHHPLAPNRHISSGRQFSPWRTLVFKNMGSGTPLPTMASCVALANFLSQKHALCFSIPARVTFVARATFVAQATSPFFSPFYVSFLGSCLDHSFPAQLG